jgi:polygalacturonase
VFASQDYQSWNRSSNGKDYIDFWTFDDSQNLTFHGTGLVDGGGYWWWMREYVMLNKGRRPRLVQLNRVRNALFEGVKYQNSPSYHLSFNDVDNFLL